MQIRQFSIWMTKLHYEDAQDNYKIRPVLVLSCAGNLVKCVKCTTNIETNVLSYQINHMFCKLTKPTCVVFKQIYTIPKSELFRFVGMLCVEDMLNIMGVLRVNRIMTEQILCEDIDNMRQYYHNIPYELFQAFIELDPTYNKGSSQPGTYAKFILKLADKNIIDIDDGHITDALTRFEDVKSKLKNKDIMRFKSVEELDAYLNDENSYNELTDRQQLRQTQVKVHKADVEKDLIAESSQWKIYSPSSYENSCKLGRGTSWCTATTENSYYYNSYTDDGKLFIIVSKKDPNTKYQFHFESGSYMDKDDRAVDPINYIYYTFDSAIKDVLVKYVANNILQLSDDNLTQTIDISTLEYMFNRCEVSSRNSISTMVAFQLLVDPFEEVITWDFVGTFNPDAGFPSLSRDTEQFLKDKTGLTESDAQDIILEQPTNEYYDALFAAYSRASDEAALTGAAIDAHADAVSALEDCLPDVVAVDYIPDVGLEVTCKSIDDVVKAYLELDSIDEYANYFGLELIVGSCIRYDYVMFEPQDGYSTRWDSETFNRTFRDVLSEEL